MRKLRERGVECFGPRLLELDAFGKSRGSTRADYQVDMGIPITNDLEEH